MRGSLDHVVLIVATYLHHIVLNDCDTTRSRKVPSFAHTLVVLLGLDDVSPEHLGIFDFDLRIVENIIIVVYVLNYFNWLVLLFLGFG